MKEIILKFKSPLDWLGKEIEVKKNDKKIISITIDGNIYVGDELKNKFVEYSPTLYEKPKLITLEDFFINFKV